MILQLERTLSLSPSRASLAAALFCLALPNTVAAQAAEPAPPAFLQQARVESSQATTVDTQLPQVAGPNGPIHLQVDSFYEELRNGEIWQTRVVNTTLPEGTRVFPIVELERVRFSGLPPGGVAILLPEANHVRVGSSISLEIARLWREPQPFHWTVPV